MKQKTKTASKLRRKPIRNQGRQQSNSLSYAALEPKLLLAGDANPLPSSDGLWFPDTLAAIADPTRTVAVQARQMEIFNLDISALREKLVGAPLEFTDAAVTRSPVISIPTPLDTYEPFEIVQAPVMERGLADRFPQIKTYRGQSLINPANTIRFDVSHRGFHAQVISPVGGTYYVDPYFHLGTETYAAYFRFDAISTDHVLVQDQMPDIGFMANNQHGSVGEYTFAPPFGGQLRTYQLAVSATGEYTQYHGGTIPDALAAIVTTVNHVNQVFENDLAVRMVLVANNDQIIFTNGTTDPFTNEDAQAILDENQQVTDSTIGSNNYDVGHVLSTNGGGLAFVGVVGEAGFKAQGTTGSSHPQGTTFDIDLVAHELGHQFGASHSWNGNSGSCDAQSHEPGEAYEPGSGSTIMGYAGICGNDNLQIYADPMFHSISIDKIRQYVTTGVGNSSATITSTGNSVPTVDGGPDFVIPAGTPFELTAEGHDLDNGDELTYSWEQRDLGPRQDVNAGDNGSSPIFRTYAPTSLPNRVFPRMSDLVDNSTAIGETLPTTDRTLNFRVVVRDNASGGGGVNEDNVQVNVNPTGAPFRVTSHNSSTTWKSGTLQPVNWDVAGTVSNGIYTTGVDIFLSIDGGLTFPVLLAQGVPNDGTQYVTVPNADTSQARIKIKGSGNIFFDINDVDFTILPPDPAVIVANSYSRTLVTEGGTRDYYTVGLTTVPSGSVFVTITADGESQVSTDEVNFFASIVVDLTNDVPRQIFVRAIDDAVPEDNHVSTIIHAINFSSDPTNYPVSMNIADMDVTVIDNDTQGIGETGIIEEIQDQWLTIHLNQTYTNPVVIAGPSSFGESDSSVVRVRNVTVNSFQIRIDEWDYQNEVHTLENVGYMVIESGTHLLAGGTIVTAGVAKHVNSGWKTVDSLNAGGVLLTTVVSENDSATIAARVRNVGNSFEVYVQEEQAADGIHGAESVAWVQFGTATGYVDNLQLVSTFSPTGISSVGRTVNFGTTFSNVPVLLAGMQTTYGGDPAALRRNSLTNSTAYLFVEEEKSLDNETVHGNEDVGFVAIDVGILKLDPDAPQQIGESRVVSVNSNWKDVTFSHSYSDPVIVFGSMTSAGNQASTVRIRNLTATGFEVKVREWDYLDGNHGFEELGFTVVESGLHVLPDGTLVQAGKTTSYNAFRRIIFDTPFQNVPIVMSQPFSENGYSAITTRMRNITSMHFDFQIQEEEFNDNIHAAESIGWIAIEQAVGDGYEINKTGNTVTHNPFALSFAQSYSIAPVFVAQMQSYNGGDPANVRHSSLNTGGATVFIQEEQSLDSEIAHGNEIVGYFAMQVGGIFSSSGASPFGGPDDFGLPRISDPSNILDGNRLANYVILGVDKVSSNGTLSPTLGTGIPHRNSLLPRINNVADLLDLNSRGDSPSPLEADKLDAAFASFIYGIQDISDDEHGLIDLLPQIDSQIYRF